MRSLSETHRGVAAVWWGSLGYARGRVTGDFSCSTHLTFLRYTASMPNYIRNYVPGATYFFTVVTHLRRPFLTSDLARNHLHNAIETIKKDLPFTIDAWVLLPDHLHAIWTLPDTDADYSTRWKQIKEEFTRTYLAAGGTEGPVSESRRRRKERGVWQRHFWNTPLKMKMI